MSTINFILPPGNDTPIGGYKVVYQYANELSKRGYNVIISFLYHINPLSENTAVLKLKRLRRRVLHTSMPARKITWFKLDPRVQLRFNIITSEELPDADVVIATAAPTATFLSAMPISKGEKFYFIQSFESWSYSNVEELIDTYKLGLNNIVISHALQKKVESLTGIRPTLLPNFYDDKEFFLTKDLTKRSSTVALLNHTQTTKRTRFGLEVLKEVKKRVPSLQVLLFGAYPPVCQLPNYVKFTYKATTDQLRNDIYGKAKIYLLPSTLEGWGLTGTEAMACGAALIASDIGGIKEYANQTNSILIDPSDKQKFINVTVELLNNENRRLTLVEEALNDVKQFTLKQSTDKLETIIAGG